jgi:hypothetical protein
MDEETFRELVSFDIELGRWKHLLSNLIRENSNLPGFIIDRMCIEELVEYVIKSREELTKE